MIVLPQMCSLRSCPGVFAQAECQFAFEICGLTLKDDWLTFYIKPENGFELPAIMKWIKQMFAQRYNHEAGRIGHLWGIGTGRGYWKGSRPGRKGWK